MSEKNTRDGSVKGLALIPIGTGTGLAAAIVTALIFCGVAMALPDPDAAIGFLAPASMLIGAAVSGISSAVMSGCTGYGAVSGAMYTLIIWLASLFLKDCREESGVLRSLIGYAAAVALSFAAGAIMSGVKGKKNTVRVREGGKSPAAIARQRLTRGK